MKTKFNGILTLLLAFIVQITFAQEKTISGTVSDENGPLPGVSVLKKGTKQGVETDFDGNYKITAKTGDVLIYSFVGMQTVEKTVGSSSKISVTMSASNDNTLEEIIVTGYTSQKESEITGSVEKIGSEALKSVVTPTVDQALQGKVAGLSMTSNSGSPGANSTIRIRGISSITAGNDPLYVIDGVPVTNDNVSSSNESSQFSALSAFDSNDIESITVLKDATAVAQYGARGANGVILITTKSGKNGKTKFSFSTSYGFSNDAIEGPKPLTAAERLELSAEALYNDGDFSSVEDAKKDLLSKSYKSWDEAGRPNIRWNEVVKNNDAPIVKVNFSASGGSDNHKFYTGLGYTKQEGTVIGSEFERYSAKINFSKDLSSKFKFSSNNTASYSEQTAFLERGAYFESPRTVQYFINPTINPYNEDGSLSEFGGSLPNPLILLRDNERKNLFTRIVSNNSLTWDIGNGFEAGTRANIDYQVYNYKFFGNRNYGYSSEKSGEASQYYRNNVTYTLQNYIGYDLNIDNTHTINFKALQEYQTNRSYFLGADGENFADDGLVNLDNAGKPVAIYSNFNDWYVGAYLGLIHYSGFNGKYVADISFRREANSRFDSKYRWGNFWSVGGAWNIHKESFMENSKVFNNLKLRTSYGTTGNANIQLNRYQPKFSFDDSYNGQGSQKLGNLGNKLLSWETSSTFDLGLDFGIYNNLIKGSIGYFNRTTNDLLLDVDTSFTAGQDSQYQNIGSLSNSGIEFDINFNVVNTEDFNFTIGGNIATVKNEVLELAKDANGIEKTQTTSTTRLESGHSVREFYMPTWAGVNPETGAEEWYIDGKGGETTTVFNDAKAVYQGANAVPTLTAGLNVHLDYKGVYFDASAFYSGGNKIYEGWHRYLNQTNGFPLFAFNGYNSLLDRWQKSGDTGVRHGKITSGYTPWQRHTKYLYDGDFMRLRTVTFGYKLPKSVINKIGLDNVRIYVSGNNLYTWVKDKDLLYDPEVGYGQNDGTRAGETGLETPPSKNITFGLNVNF